LDLPVYLARSSKDLILTLKELTRMDLILIDTVGCNMQELDRVHQNSSWMDNYNATQSAKSAFIKKILLVPAGGNIFDLRKMVQEFSELKLNGLGITKTDETCYFGPCLNTVLQQAMPLNFVTSGQSMDEGIEIEKNGLANKVVNLLFRANRDCKINCLC
jgi:flagellar biosynthesis protein FlhF